MSKPCDRHIKTSDGLWVTFPEAYPHYKSGNKPIRLDGKIYMVLYEPEESCDSCGNTISHGTCEWVEVEEAEIAEFKVDIALDERGFDSEINGQDNIRWALSKESALAEMQASGMEI